MLSKIKLTGTIELLSGLHIGGSDAFAAIGAIDSPVIRDPLTNLPLLPGTSLKGKMRSLLAQARNRKVARKPDEDAPEICRLFGATTGGGADGGAPQMARVIFRDALLSNPSELFDRGVTGLTEAKFENTINRCTAIATPRQIERVIRGSKFDLELIYDVIAPDQALTDLRLIRDGLNLLEADYLGGNGSRGYGKVRFNNLSLRTVFGDFDVVPFESLFEGDHYGNATL